MCNPTRRGNTHYVCLLEDSSDAVLLKNAPKGLSHAQLLKDGTPVKLQQQEDGLLLIVPSEQRDPFCTVVQVE